MKISSNWVKNGALLATAIAAVLFMSGYGLASAEKLWTEKTILSNSSEELTAVSEIPNKE